MIIESRDGYVGMIVRCVKRHNSETHDLDGHPTDRNGERWVIDPPLPSRFGTTGLQFTFPDSFMRPIRDSDGQDETLTWAPKKVTA